MNQRETNSADFFQALFFSMAIGCLLIALASLFFGADNFLQNSPYPFLAIVVGLMFLLKFPGKRGK